MKNLLLLLFLIVPILASAQNWVVIDSTITGSSIIGLRKVKVDRYGNVWSLNSSNLFKFDGINWTSYNSSNSPIVPNSLMNFIIDKNDNKWIASWSGLYKYDNANWTFYNTSNSCLPTNHIYACDIDSLNNAWLATDSGIVKFDGNTNCITYTNTGGMDILVDSRNWVWAGVNSGTGLCLYDGISWLCDPMGYYMSSFSDFLSPNDLFLDSAGNVWGSILWAYLGYSRGIFKHDGTNFSVPFYDSIPECGPICVNSSFVATTFHGHTLMYHNISWNAYNNSNSPLPSQEIIQDLAGDQCNNLWIAGAFALYEFNPNGINNCFTNLEENKSNNLLNYFPNPAQSNSTITIIYPSSSSQKEIIINDINGREIARYALPQWSSTQTVKLPQMAAGIYIARLTGEKEDANVKFVVE
jgi:hypothetical protein